ncbi:MAG TPA: protoheme IX farnesyltransferase, partial [Actinomycetota bacterium]|nr:protoheme IX farnesyltransferase [Actinomycetota bacterium]
MKTIGHVAHARRHATDVRAIAWSYFRLTKPRIVLLLLITTVPSMMLAARGLPSVWLIAATLLGGTA